MRPRDFARLGRVMEGKLPAAIPVADILKSGSRLKIKR